VFVDIQPLQLTHLDEECEAKMLQAVRTIPSTCSQRIAELNQTIWTQLDNNEWLFVAPNPEVLTFYVQNMSHLMSP
jgi:hypothetical protein